MFFHVERNVSELLQTEMESGKNLEKKNLILMSSGFLRDIKREKMKDIKKRLFKIEKKWK